MNLEEFRIMKGFTYEELADFLGMKLSTTYRVCKGYGPCVSLKTAHQIVSRTQSRVFYSDLLDSIGDC